MATLTCGGCGKDLTEMHEHGWDYYFRNEKSAYTHMWQGVNPNWEKVGDWFCSIECVIIFLHVVIINQEEWYKYFGPSEEAERNRSTLSGLGTIRPMVPA